MTTATPETNRNKELLEELLASRNRKIEEAKAKAEPTPVKEAAPIKLGEGEKLFSDIFGFTPPLRGDFAVKPRDRAEFPEWAHDYIPEVQTTYIFPQSQTEAVVAAIYKGKRAGFGHGPKGCGKSKLGEQVCARLGIPFFRVNFSEDAESSRLFGSVDVVEGSLDWVKGAAEMAAELGAFLQLDEVSACPPGISLSMQWMLERNGKFLLENKPARAGERLITPKAGFHVFCTDNTTLQGDTSGRYTGTQVQNEAFIDRMQYTLEFTYLTNEQEQEMVKGYYPKVKMNVIKNMVKVAGFLRTMYDNREISQTVSTRGLIEWAEEIDDHGSVEHGFRIAIFNRYSKKDQPKLADTFQKVFAVSL